MSKDQYPSETSDRYIVRFPDGMRDMLKQLAAENKRSLNAEIIARLEQTLIQGSLVAASVPAAKIEDLVERAVRRVLAETRVEGETGDKGRT